MKQGSQYRRTLRTALFTGLIAVVSPGWAAGISGVVHDSDGQLLEGAMVTLMDERQKRLTTRYTNAEGVYQFDEVAADENNVRVRLIGYSDQQLALAADTTELNATLVSASREELIQQLPAHVWAERVALDDDATRREFRVQCMMCHQQGYPNARWPQTKEDWYGVFDRMAHKRALLTEETRVTMADALLKAFDVSDGKPLPRTPPAPKGLETQVEITEWRLDDFQVSMHDVAVGPDGKIYGVDTVGNDIWRLDPETNEVKALTHLKPKNRGEDAEMLLHTVIQAPDGAMWFTYAAGNLVARLDVYTEEMKVWEISYLDGIYPHTMRFDSNGQIWFTVTITNQLGTIDPELDEVVLYDMPTRNLAQTLVTWPPITIAALWAQKAFELTTTSNAELMPTAYGIDVTPDDKIWFSQYNNRRIGYFDKATEEFHMVDTPFGGPRRFRTDSKGNLWIPAYTDGLIYRYEPEKDEFTPFEMPTGRGDSTYALAVDPKDDTVWACGSNSDSMMHLNPKNGDVVTYRLPTRVTFCREIGFSDDGSVWTSYSNYPSVSIEGSTSVFVRIKPLTEDNLAANK